MVKPKLEVPKLTEEIKTLNGKSGKELQKKLEEMIKVCKPSNQENKKENSQRK